MPTIFHTTSGAITFPQQTEADGAARCRQAHLDAGRLTPRLPAAPATIANPHRERRRMRARTDAIFARRLRQQEG